MSMTLSTLISIAWGLIGLLVALVLVVCALFLLLVVVRSAWRFWRDGKNFGDLLPEADPESRYY